MLEVKLFAGLELKSWLSLRQNLVEYRPGLTLGDAIDSLGLPRAAAAILMVNGHQSRLDTELHDGDRVALFPPVGGG
jgi:molybdopterin synthase sulfur carrier subunit